MAITDISGTPGFDQLNGTEGDDSIQGFGGNDNLSGGAGNDTLDGGSGNDFLQGGSGNDSILGGTGGDLILPGSGSDTVDGGAILDRANFTDGNTVRYDDATAAINLDLSTGIVLEGSGDTDRLANINFVVATAFNDTLKGTADATLFEMFEGGAGNDSIDGGALDPSNPSSANRVVYLNAPAGVNVNLTTNIAQDGYGTQDTLANINQVRASSFADTLVGSDRTDLTESFEGRGGNDLIDGKGGIDQVRYDAAGSGVVVNLATGIAQDGQGGTDTLSGIEGVRGGSFADSITGSDTSAFAGTVQDFEFFTGNAGNDTIDGGAGYDRADYNTASTGVSVTLGGTGAGTAQDGTFFNGVQGTDTLLNIEAVRGGSFNDTLTGSDTDAFSETFDGGGGNDVIDGKGGIDRVDYKLDPGAVAVHLGWGLANDGYGGTDILRNIERVRGSAFDDSIVGAGGNETIEGLAGDDTLAGGGGADTFLYLATPGAQGFDVITDFAAGDIIEVGAQLSTATPSSGIGTSVGEGQVQVWDTGSGTMLSIGTDTVAGADLQILLVGTYAREGFSIVDTGAGSSRITYSGTIGPVTGPGGFREGDVLVGMHWNDTLDGGDAADTIRGDEGNDLIRGGAGNDSLSGEAGSDNLIGGAGNDTLDGGAILDRTNYLDLNRTSYATGATAGIVANLQTGQVQDGQGGTDTLVNVNFLQGTAFADSILGSTEDNLFEEFEGLAGNDTIDGGAVNLLANNSNRVTYVSSPNGVTVTLTATGGGTAQDGFGTTDTLLNISNVRGSNFVDVLTGSDRTDVTESFDGRAGNDTIDGLGGNDVARYDGANGAVTVNLATGTATESHFVNGASVVGTDTLRNIEGVRGGNFADTLTGSDTSAFAGTSRDFEFFHGLGGNDSIDGGGGYDRVDYTTARFGVSVKLGGTEAGSAIDGEGGFDTLLNIEAVRGGDFADLLSGSDSGGFESFEGRAGNDSIDGLGGVDRIDYQFDLAGVEVHLSQGWAKDGFGGTDQLRNIENVRGSAFDDDIIGSAAANHLAGGGGNDILEGLGGSDTLVGGAGSDEFILSPFMGDLDVIMDLEAGERIFIGLDDDLDAAFLTGSDPSGLVEGQVMFAPASGGFTQVFVGIDMAPGADVSFKLNGSFTADQFVAAFTQDDESFLLYRPAAVSQTGTAEGDWLYGSNFAETLTGLDGDDILLGYGGNDSLAGGNGDDQFLGDAGIDTIDGGAGFDHVHYDLTGAMAAGINANLATQTVSSGGETDQLASIEGISGTDFADTLVGSTGANSILGGDGDDLILGQPTAGNVAGGAYQGAATGGDTLLGADGNDTLQGGAADDTLSGGDDDWDGMWEPGADGADTFVFNASGNGTDLITDFDGSDTIRIGATLSTSTPTAGDGAGVTGNNVQVQASGTGDSAVTTLSIDTNGAAGAEVRIQLAGGFEAAQFVVTNNGNGSSSIRYVYPGLDLVGTQNSDTLNGGFGNDTLSGMDGSDMLSGGFGNDSILGGAGWDNLQGGAGDDTLDGGADSDSVAYWDADGAVFVDLAAGVAQGRGNDSLSNIEQVYTGWGNDTVVGNDANNYLSTNDGNDSINAGAGSDFLAGGRGHDTLTGGAGADLFDVQAGAFGDVTRITDLQVGDALLTSYNMGGSTLLVGVAPGTLLQNQFVLGAPADGVTRVSIGMDSVAGADRFVDLVGSFTPEDFVKVSNFSAGPYGFGGDIYKYDPEARLPKTLVGTENGDFLEGGYGNDTISGLGGFDDLRGSAGDDLLQGGADGDQLYGGPGNDTLDGGAGWDQAAYWNVSTPLNIDLSTQTATGEGTDTLLDIESVVAGGGNDTLTGDGNVNQLHGSHGDDIVSGGGGDDIVEGGYGNDTLTGGAGTDLFVTNEGFFNEVDRVTDLQAGDALYLGWGSSTVLLAGVSADSLLAGQMVLGAPADGVTRLSIGMDSIAGADRFVDLVGSFSADVFLKVNNYSAGGFGRSGDIYRFDPAAKDPVNLVGTDDWETLTGANGNDTLSGMGGGDDLRGNAGDDLLQGGAGGDTLSGGPGNDTLDGGADTDTANYNNIPGSVTVDLAAGTATGEGSDSLVGIENVWSGNGNDTLVGDANSNTLSSGWGNDSLSGGDGADLLDAGAGSDTITGGAGADLLVFTATGFGVTDVDRVTDLQLGDGLVVGWTGSRTFLTSGDASSLVAGQMVLGTPVDGVTRLHIGLDSMAGADYAIDLVGSFVPLDFALVSSFQLPQFTYFADILVFDPSANEPKTLTGTEFNDNLSGGAANDTISGLGGNDALRGNGGDDLIQGGAGWDQLRGDAGNDTLEGGDDVDEVVYEGTQPVAVDLVTGVATGQGNDSLAGIENVRTGGGNDTLTGDAAANELRGGFGNDSISGGAGDDYIDGEWGSDTLAGGAGIDLFQLADGAVGDVDRVLDLAVGDALRLGWFMGATTLVTGVDPGSLTSGQLLFGAPADGVTRIHLGIDLNAGADRYVDLVGSFSADHFLQSGQFTLGGMTWGGDFYIYDPTAADPKLITGTANSDTLNGGNADDTISGLDGSDQLTGGRGNDLLQGGAGGDRLYGGDGNDTLQGDDSFDELNGGAGDDLLQGGASTDTLRGDAGNDTLDGGADNDYVYYWDADGPVLVDLAAGTAVTARGNDSLVGIENVYAGSSNDTLLGDGGSNQLAGGWGNDSLSGGGGDDRLLGERGSDTMTGGAGTDLFFLGEMAGAEDVDRITDLQVGDALRVSWNFDSTQLLQSGDSTTLAQGQLLLGTPTDGVTRLYQGLDATPGADLFYDLVGTFFATDFVKLSQLQLGSYLETGEIYQYNPGAGLNPIDGTDGDDTLTGTSGGDRIDGRGGNDNLQGQDGNDVILGGAGNDFIDVGGGADSVNAGDGNDHINASGWNAAGADTIDGGAGYDIVGYGLGNVQGGVTFVAAELVPGASVQQSDPTDGTIDTLINIEEIHIYGGGSADTLIGNNQRNYIEGWDGNDTLTGNGGNDTFAFDLGANRGVDRITDLATGDDLFFRNATLTGSILSGDNTAALGAGRVMIGSPTTLDGATVTRVYVNGPSGIQEVRLLGSYSAANFTLVTNPGGGTSLAYAEPLTLTGTAGPDVLNGAGSSDTISGLDGNDSLNGMDGNDVLLGGAGNDFIEVGGGADSVDAGAGDDHISAGGWSSPGADTIDGGEGFDTAGYGFGNLQQGATFTAAELGAPGVQVQQLDPSDGSIDLLVNIESIHAYGSQFADTFIGNSTNNFFDGWGGNDTLTGGGGNDNFGYDANRDSGVDRITDLASGDMFWFNALVSTGPVASGDEATGLQAGRIMIGSPTAVGDLTLTRIYWGSNVGVQQIDLVGSYDAADFQLVSQQNGTTLSYHAPQTITGTAGNDLLQGGGGRDTITGLEGNDTLWGQDGNDVLVGGAGNDQIDVGGGADSVDGGDGDDNISAGGWRQAGADTIDGGGGYDRVSYGFGGFDHGFTFTMAELGAPGVTVQQFDPTDGTTDLLTNVEEIQAWGGDFADSITGNSGRNFIEGWGGNDSLTGGGNNDTFAWEFSRNLGTDRITDFGSGDSLHFRNFTIAGPVLTGDDPSGLAVGRVMVGTPALIDGVMVTRLFVGTTLGLHEIQLAGSISPKYFSINLNSGHSNLNYNAPNVLGTPNDDTTLAGTGGNDFIDLLAGNDSVDGGNGNDAIYGGAGNDTLRGGSGFDTLVGEDGNDLLDGGNEDDTLIGGSGFDTLLGGNGFDTVSYAYLAHASGHVIDAFGGSVNVRGRGDNAGYFESDAISSIDVFIGSQFSDVMRDQASNRETYFLGGAGDDTLSGSPWDFSFDFVSYWDRNASQYVVADLAAGIAQVYASADNALLETDRLWSFRGVFGTSGHDSLTGDAKDNYFRGSAGNDTIDGGGGNDIAAFSNSSGALNITLAEGGAEITVADGMGGTDTLRNIERVHGGSGNDSLVGNSSDNRFRGGLGDDTLDGGAGLDVADYRNGAVNITLAAVGQETIAKDGAFVNGVEGTDVLRSIEGLTGSTSGDTLVGNEVDNYLWGNSGNDVLSGGFGNDTLDGGSDFDTARHDYLQDANGYTFVRDTRVGVTASTLTITGRGSNASYSETDAIFWMERFAGTAGNDVMRDAAASYWTYFQGGAGNDTIEGNIEDIDFSDYSERDSTFSLDANLGTGVVKVSKDGAVVETDQLVAIRGIWGTAGGDSMVGSDAAHGESFRGMAGNDTIDGGAGTRDVADYRNANVGVTITLADSGDTTADDGQGGTDTLRNIEGLSGSGLNDALTGNAGDNILIGRGGNDTLAGGAGFDVVYYLFSGSGVNITLDESGNASGFGDGEGGSDTLTGIEGLVGSDSNDTLRGNGQANLLQGEDGDDLLSGRGGNDTLTGGVGTDTFDYSYLPNASGANGYDITIHASQVVVTGRGTNAAYSETDEVDMVELVWASDGDDVLTDATVGRETFMRGGLGNDTIVGQLTENDFTIYTERSVSVVADLGQQRVTIGSEVDTLVGIRGVWGGSADDTLVGSSEVNIFRGRGGNDSIDGAGGTDYVDYRNALHGVNVQMAAPGSSFTVADGEGGVDTLVNIEGIFGSNHDDVFVGNAADNIFRGRNGWDVLDGGAGRDGADYANANHGLRITLAQVGQETFVADDGEGGSDRLISIESLFGGGWDDVLTGNEADNTLRGRGGNDTLDGGEGLDIADYQGTAGSSLAGSLGLQITLAETGPTIVQDGYGTTDTLISIEGLVGSSFDDTLGGNGQANVLSGNLGNDALNGGAGNDTLSGGAGNDTLTGGDGADVFSYGARNQGIDRITDFLGGDTIRVNALLGAVSSGNGSGVSGNGVQVLAGENSTTLFIDTDNTAGAELQIELAGVFKTAGFQVATAQDGTSQITYAEPTEQALGGIAYHWKNHALLGNVGVAATGSQAPILASTDAFDLRGMQYNAADNSVTVQLWTNTTTGTGSFDFTVSASAASSVAFTSALGTGWTVLANPLGSTSVRVGMITSDPTSPGVTGATLLGTARIVLDAGQTAAQVNFTEVEVGTTGVANTGFSLDMVGGTGANGQFQLTLPAANYALSAARGTSDIGNAVTSADALAALRLAVGLNPNTTAPLTVSPYQLIAADANEDGKVTSADALAILRMAVKLPIAPAHKWMFVNERLDLWNETGNTSLLTRSNTLWDRSLAANLGEGDATLNLVGVLRGDVNGSWSAPANSQDLDVLQPNYFQELAAQLNVPVAIWGI